MRTKSYESMDSLSFSLPFRDGGDIRERFGELAIAADVKEGRRRVDFVGVVGECVAVVGVPGRDVLFRVGEVAGDSPAVASVMRNSTHKRENDWIKRLRKIDISISANARVKIETDLCLVALLQL